ncbi:YbaN family protein [Qingshengfaniella alkalisoli]|uniref:DUF454 domain-containing protein n=1 Tax=Qingshengfaniella alkalisoli TaxID=2599296 RepID=A0A5B8IV54_9RHOB|nr:YbaN family protein [Qingshengfaniella alkalisoli]QDY69992.1 DUF454 domain-containing protein [Qingshengfaniella alkalisoli]
MRAAWFIFGCLSVAIGFVGAFLPLLPTVPLLILAAFCFARSSPKLHEWLLTHPIYGPHIRDWQERGAISRRAKRLAVASCVATFGIALLLGLPIRLLILQAVVLLSVCAFILTRPSS